MRRTVLIGLGIGVSGAGIVLAALSPDLPLALAGGVLAIASAGAVAALGLGPPVEQAPAAASPGDRDPVAGMRGAFSRHSLGREQVIFAIQGLEIAARPSKPTTVPPDELRRLLDLPAPQFRGWLESRLDDLERET